MYGKQLWFLTGHLGVFYKFKIKCRSIKYHLRLQTRCRSLNTSIRKDKTESCEQKKKKNKTKWNNEFKSQTVVIYIGVGCCFTCMPRQNILQRCSVWWMKAQSLRVMLYKQVKQWREFFTTFFLFFNVRVWISLLKWSLLLSSHTLPLYFPLPYLCPIVFKHFMMETLFS